MCTKASVFGVFSSIMCLSALYAIVYGCQKGVRTLHSLKKCLQRPWDNKINRLFTSDKMFKTKSVYILRQF